MVGAAVIPRREIAPETPADRDAIRTVHALAFGQPNEADLGFCPRFGFVPAPPPGLPCEFAVPDEVFMVTELEAGSLGRRPGMVRYHPRFQTA